MEPRQKGRFQIELHPPGASVSLFRLERIVKYKRGTRDQRANELRRLRELALSWLPAPDPSLTIRLPLVLSVGSTKPVEDRIDAMLCAYVGACWWTWATQLNRLYGDEESGYIVVPHGTVAR